MKNLLLGLFTLLMFSLSSGQVTEKLDYCNCIDRIEQFTSVFEGKYERVCNGKINETGAFKNDKKDGEWITYNRKGGLIKRMNYLNGQLNGKCELFFANGDPKLTVFFDAGNRVGKWTYFTSKGKTFIEGEYQSDKPIGIWTINDKKGKTPVIQYDFDSAKYLVNQSVALHKDNDIVQNSNTGEYYILRYPNRPIIKGTAPLGGFNLSGDLFVELIEVPLDYWDTYISYKYKARFSTSLENKTTVTVALIPDHMSDDFPIYPFIIRTNDNYKIKKVEHNELSKKLLELKILETLNLLPPWIYVDKEETEVYIPYVINRIIKF